MKIAVASRTELSVVETGGFVRWMVSVDHSTHTRNFGAAAEIVAGFNNICSGSDSEGLSAIGNANGSWVGARGIWNQHTYSVTNVNDDGTIPSSLSSNDTFRAQKIEGSIFLAPD